MSNAPDRPLVIGVGHAERQDDAVGPYVARALSRRGQPAVVHEGDGTGLLDLWERHAACVVVDAVAGAGPPGRVQVFTDLDGPLFGRAVFIHSSHRLGLPEAVALGRMLGRMPARLAVVGITGAAFGFGPALSPSVAVAAERVIERLASAEDAFAALVAADPFRR